MPLLPGSSDKVIGVNISTLIREGRPKAQAIAISIRKAGKAKREKAIHSAMKKMGGS